MSVQFPRAQTNDANFSGAVYGALGNFFSPSVAGRQNMNENCQLSQMTEILISDVVFNFSIRFAMAKLRVTETSMISNTMQ